MNWSYSQLSSDEEEEETRIKQLKKRGKRNVVHPPPPTKRQQSMIDSGLHVSEIEAQRIKDEERLESYIYDEDDFDHDRLSDDFYFSGNEMYNLQEKVKEEAELLIGNKKPMFSGSTARQLYNAALSKFKELDRRVQLIHPLLIKAESPAKSLTADEWDSLRFEMVWIIGVRESYYGWDWKKDGTKR
jgi:hypothetical protein